MSNSRPFRRHGRTYRQPDQLDDVCVFCRIIQLADHIGQRVVPTMTAADQLEARRIVAELQTGANELHELAAHGR